MQYILNLHPSFQPFCTSHLTNKPRITLARSRARPCLNIYFRSWQVCNIIFLLQCSHTSNSMIKWCQKKNTTRIGHTINTYKSITSCHWPYRLILKVLGSYFLPGYTNFRSNWKQIWRFFPNKVKTASCYIFPLLLVLTVEKVNIILKYYLSLSSCHVVKN